MFESIISFTEQVESWEKIFWWILKSLVLITSTNTFPKHTKKVLHKKDGILSD